MLKPVRTVRRQKSAGSFVIVASRYNARYVDAMLAAAKAELNRAGASVRVIRVPGAFEIPAVAAKTAAGARRRAFRALSVWV
jgi:6,7-dimethyl-8-ribityllumazine synthase